MKKLLGFSMVLCLGVAERATAQTADINPSKDNTLYESGTGALSNGAGNHIFAGRTATGIIRRAVIHFDVAGEIPAGATIQSVTLTMFMSRTITGNQPVALHRLTADWGEGDSQAIGEEGGGAASQTGDATWIHRFFDDTNWTTPGGDYEATASATQDVGAEGQTYSWSSPAMAADVQAWLDDPGNNFGWIVIGNEAANSTAKRFDSRHHPTEANRPLLTVDYSAPASVDHWILY